MKKNEILIAAFTLLLFTVLFIVFRSVLVYILVSAVFAIVGSPVVKLFQKIKFKKFSIGKGFASLLTLVTFYAFVGFAILTFLPYLTEEAQQFSTINPTQVLESSQGPIKTAENLIFEYTDKQVSIEQYAKEKIISILSFATFSHWINAITSFTGNFLMYFFALSFITFFFLKDGKMIFEYFKHLLPSKSRDAILLVLPQIRKKLTRYFAGIGIEVCIIFLAMSIGLYFSSIEYFFVIALVAALFNIIPYIGPLVGIAFGVVVTVVAHCTATEECWNSLLPILGSVLLVFAVVQIIDNFVLQPIIYGKSVNAHPLEIFLVVLIVGNTWGILGMIIAIPAWSVVKIIISEIRKNSTFLNNVYKNNTP